MGALIDDLDWEDIMGTICGDDTCLIICRTEDGAQSQDERLLSMM